MSIRMKSSNMLASLLFALSLFTAPLTMAQDVAAIDIAEFHQILDSINKANIPENVKDQLFNDLRNSMIENVRLAELPEDVKRTLIKDLQSASR